MAATAAKKTTTTKKAPAKKTAAKKTTSAKKTTTAPAARKDRSFVDRAGDLSGDVQAFVEDATARLEKLREAHQDTHANVVPARNEQGLALAHRRVATSFGDVEAALAVARTAAVQLADEAAAVPQP